MVIRHRTRVLKRKAAHPAAFLFCSFVLLLCSGTAGAQNMPKEVGFWGAHQGQLRLEAESASNHGFFQNPDIGHLYFSFVSNGVQSLAVFVESAAERRTRDGLWSDVYFGNQPNEYRAHIDERVGMTVLGLETSRNVLTIGDFRFGGTIGLGFGFGGTDADVQKIGSDTVAHYSSAFSWQGFLVSFALRARYSVFVTGAMDIGIIAGARYWGYPYIGPVATTTSYNGPDFRNANDIGYMAGIAVGF